MPPEDTSYYGDLNTTENMKELEVNAFSSEGPDTVLEALRTYGYSSAPTETYVVQPTDRWPPFEIEVIRQDDTTLIRTPSSSRRDAVESAVRDLTDEHIAPKDSKMVEIPHSAFFDIVGGRSDTERFTEVSLINIPADTDD